MADNDSSAIERGAAVAGSAAGEVIHHEFGRDAREQVRTFCRLMNLVESHERAVLADPLLYLRMAGNEIHALNMKLENARQALWSTDIKVMRVSADRAAPIEIAPIETIVVPKEEYLKWQRVRAIIDPASAAPSPTAKEDERR